jgi:hypothetical protein
VVQRLLAKASALGFAKDQLNHGQPDDIGLRMNGSLLNSPCATM